MSNIIIEKEAISKFGNIFTKYKENEWLFPCPSCKKYNRENLHVNMKNGLFHCFHCHYKGKLKSIPKLSSDIINKENSDAIKEKEQYVSYLMPFHRFDLTDEQYTALYKRGLDDNTIQYYNITGGNRVQIPNYVKGNFSDIICAWEWRKDKINKYNPKYLYTEGVKKGNILFNLHNIPEKIDNVFLCEGIFNAITAGKNAVASYGCNLSNNQLNLLINKKPKSITIAYDSDEAGVLGSSLVIDKLKSKNYVGNVYYILLQKGIDINDMGHERFLDYYSKNKIKIDLDSKISKNIPNLLFRSL